MSVMYTKVKTLELKCILSDPECPLLQKWDEKKDILWIKKDFV